MLTDMFNPAKYINLTDLVNALGSDLNNSVIVKNWFKKKTTIEFLGLWEINNNPEFNKEEYNIFLNEAARKTFTTSIQEWIDFTQAKGIYVKKGKYAGTYAHYDIAFNFALYLSNNLKLYLCEKMREKNLNLKEILTKLHNNNA